MSLATAEPTATPAPRPWAGGFFRPRRGKARRWPLLPPCPPSPTRFRGLELRPLPRTLSPAALFRADSPGGQDSALAPLAPRTRRGRKRTGPASLPPHPPDSHPTRSRAAGAPNSTPASGPSPVGSPAAAVPPRSSRGVAAPKPSCQSSTSFVQNRATGFRRCSQTNIS